MLLALPFPMKTTTTTTPARATAPGGYLGELRAHLLALTASLRRRVAFADVLQVEIAQDIVADASTQHTAASRLAYTAEQSDLEACRLLRASLADGHITADEIPVMRAALRHCTSSAAADRRITELLGS